MLAFQIVGILFSRIQMWNTSINADVEFTFRRYWLQRVKRKTLLRKYLYTNEPFKQFCRINIEWMLL